MPPKKTKPAVKTVKKSPAAAGSSKTSGAKKVVAPADPAPAEEPKAGASSGLELPGLAIAIKQLPDIIFKDVGNKLKESGKWPMIIDTTTQASTFLRYQDTNYLNALVPKDMHTETIRLALIGSLRFGKPIVIDMMEVDMFQTISDRMDELLPGLMTMLMDKSILKEENYLKLVKDVDGDTYNPQNFSPMRLEHFQVIFISKNIFPSENLLSMTYTLRIHVPE